MVSTVTANVQNTFSPRLNAVLRHNNGNPKNNAANTMLATINHLESVNDPWEGKRGAVRTSAPQTPQSSRFAATDAPQAGQTTSSLIGSVISNNK